MKIKKTKKANMSKFYVRVKPQHDGIYAVHKENCPFMDDLKKKIYLGEFISSHDAVLEAKRYFKHSDVCPFCNKEHLLPKYSLLQEWYRFSLS
ncbi:MAG: hypothetical protein EHM93_13115 [Bacteroidales bacterium]|nr:MAG: hypothetical protein EHM93_13115 [Bacteroidales bacterium]